ncbi:UNVERIFIED_CONTAM: hypothetical protein K2H54_014127 [Gekko kuhli]
MESEDAIPPEKLVEGLKLSEDQSCLSHTECDNVHTPRISEGDTPSADSEAREDDDLFHDCNDSFESRVTEENHKCEVDSSEKQTDVDEKYLLELEKDMSEEEKQVLGLYQKGWYEEYPSET